MPQHHAQIRYLVRQPHSGIDEIELRIRDLKRESCGGKGFRILNELRLVYGCDEVVTPDIAVPDSKKELVPVISFQVLAEFRIERIQVTNHSDDKRMVCDEIQHPEVVLDPGTRLHFDSALNSQRLYIGSIPVRKCGRRIRSRIR